MLTYPPRHSLSSAPTRRRVAVVAAWGLAAGLVVLPVTARADSPASNCPTTGALTTCTWTYSGGEQVFTVPANVTSVAVQAVGAAGGANRPGGDGYAAGGAGAVATGTVAVTPGQKLYIHVGGTGGEGAFGGAQGGYNGGGATGGFAGGGGGASDVRFGPDTAAAYEPAVVAAGGGGAGAWGLYYYPAVGLGSDGFLYPPGGAGGAAGQDGGVGPTYFDGYVITGNGGAGEAGGADAGGAGGGSVWAGFPGAGGFVQVGGAGGYGSGGTPGGGGGGGVWGGGGGGAGDYYDAGWGDSENATSGGGGGGGGSLPGPDGAVSANTDGLAAQVTISYQDVTPPEITPTVTGTVGNNGWYTSNIGVTWSVVDNESAISAQNGCGPVTISGDTAGQSITCSATSGGGTSASVISVKRDATPPTLGITGGPADGATYDPSELPGLPTCQASDAMSGVAAPGCLVGGYSTDPGSHQLIFTATDLAGNVATVTRTYTVQPDNSPPIIVPTVTGTQGGGGWYRSDVGVSWTVTDPQSVITSESGCGATTVKTDTAGQLVTCTATSGGGVGSNGVLVRRDTTGPVLTITGGPADGATYSAGSVPPAPTCVATDALSGPSSAPCTIVGYGTAPGSYLLTFTASDVAGNPSVVQRRYTVTQPDTTPPVVTASVSGTAGANGWYVGDVSVSWNVTDPDSAVSATSGCSAATVTADTAGRTFTCTATSAGGTSTQSVTVKRDTTAPVLSITGGPVDGASYPTGTVPAAPTCTATDALSGPATQLCSVTGYSTAPGAHTLTITAVDAAGNTATAQRSYTVVADTTAPVSTLTSGPGAVTSGQQLISVTATATVKDSSGKAVGTVTARCWNTKGVVLTLTASDAGSGVAALTYSATGAGALPSTRASTLPVIVPVTASGLTTVRYAAVDRAGNVEASHLQNVIVGNGWACTLPTPTFTVPTHGSLVVTGTATTGGRTAPFTATIRY